MIRITHHYGTLSPNRELEKRWDHMVLISAAAKAMGDLISFEKLDKQIDQEVRQWIINAEIEAKNKSRKDWLGGGQTIAVNRPDPKFLFDVYYNMFVGLDKGSILRKLHEIEKELCYAANI